MKDVGLPGGPAREPSQAAPRAGSVDDNARFSEFINYRRDFLAKKIDAHDVDITGRIVAHVQDSSGAAFLGATVEVKGPDGEVLAEARSDIAGNAVLFPTPTAETPGQQDSRTLTLVARAGEATATAPVGSGEAPQTLRLNAEAAAPKTLDVLFLIDATGSMGDEIARLREQMASVSRRVSELPSKPNVRFALTAFRDRGDAFVTRTFDFTSDVSAIEAALRDVQADGGGDTPESVNAGLHDALTKPAWREDASTVKLVFLIGDAAPHLDYDADADYVTESRDAAKRGITIEPIASSGLDDQGEYVFRQVALLTGGRFSFLTYGADGVSPGDTTTHHVSGYEALSLDDLVVRLVRDEIGATP